jgi:hypothetical protein
METTSDHISRSMLSVVLRGSANSAFSRVDCRSGRGGRERRSALPLGARGTRSIGTSWRNHLGRQMAGYQTAQCDRIEFAVLPFLYAGRDHLADEGLTVGTLLDGGHGVADSGQRT